MLSQELEICLHQAFIRARAQCHQTITVEHLLAELIGDTTTAALLISHGAKIDQLQTTLTRYIDDNATHFCEGEGDTQPSMGFQRVLQRAIMQIQSSGQANRKVMPIDILISIFNEKNSHALYCLHQQGVTRLDILNGVRSTTPRTPTLGEVEAVAGNSIKRPGHAALDAFTQNLNALAIAGKIDPLIGRVYEVERAVQILCRRSKNNPLLVGDAGVGKTAIAEGLAWRITQKQIPEILLDAVIYSLDMGALLAGTKYRGDLEMRLKNVISELKGIPNAILFIDEIHTIIGSAGSGGAMDASNLLKPVLSSGEIKCMGATTFTEYRTIFSKDAALARRFQKIDVVEPTPEQTVAILQGLKTKFEEHHGVQYSDEALQAAVHLSVKYLSDRLLPDKAIDVIDEAGAAQRLLKADNRKKTIGKNEIEIIIANIAKIPAINVSGNDRDKLKALDKNLKSVVFGQDKALDLLAHAVKMARAGLGKNDKPIGSFLFSGPTGVGKTEAAKQLAYTMGIDLVRFDMSEYMESHAVSRLIGAPPGYVGFDQGGLLTEAITKKPHCVLLLDEIEKAHPAIFNVLLQVMDHGTLTDNNGRKADFKNVVIIMTTNAGARVLNAASMGFTNSRQSEDAMIDIKRLFTPEFRNRLDAIVGFESLDKDTILRVADKFLLELELQLAQKNVEATFTDNLRQHLVKTGFDPLMGARPMQRVIQDLIRRALADELLFGRLVNGGRLTVDIVTAQNQSEILLDIKPLAKRTTKTLRVAVTNQ